MALLRRRSARQTGPALPLPRGDQELTPDARRRVELTVSCRDADAIPKVADAGEVRVEGDMAKLMALQAAPAASDPAAGEMAARLRDITA